jgi:hypothetical protein
MDEPSATSDGDPGGKSGGCDSGRDVNTKLGRNVGISRKRGGSEIRRFSAASLHADS